MALELHSEAYSASGNAGAHGVRNQLGRPRLDPLAVLVREAFQNSWDARVDQQTVRCAFDLWQASESQRQLLREQVFASRPRGMDWTVLDRPLKLCCLSDQGTHGLGGPTRADVYTHGARTDFVDFLRNLGQPPDRADGAGTFGFGKAALYAASEVHTILVWTRTRVGDALQSRLLGAALGQGYVDDARSPPVRRTGRHWWGRLEAGLAEPILDAEADRLAAGLGMRISPPGETGTSILIVGLHLEDANLRERLISAILWNYWPKLVADGAPPMAFSVSIDGVPAPIPSPATTWPLSMFVSALQLARRSGEETEILHQSKDLRYNRARVGRIALCKAQPARATPLLDAPELGGPGSGPFSHVALMRSAELVVRYLPGPPLPSNLFDYAGVFITAAEPEIERAFAASEPPTHDDWVPGGLLETRQRGIVRTALQRIRETTEAFAHPRVVDRQQSGGSPLGFLSTWLGGILMGLPGPGGEVPPPEDDEPVVDDPDEPGTGGRGSAGGSGSGEGGAGGSGSGGADGGARRGAKPRVRMSEPQLAVIDGVGVLVVKLDVRHAADAAQTRLTVQTEVLLDGDTAESEPPAGAALPQPWRWTDPTGAELPASGPELAVSAEGRWILAVRLVDDARIRVRVTGSVP